MIRKISILFLSCFVLFSCSKDEADNEDIQKTTNQEALKDLNNLIKASKPIEQIQEKNETAISSKRMVGTIGEESVYEQEFDIALPYESLNLLNSKSDIFFPGALYTGRSVTTPDYELITTERAPITVSTSLTGSGSAVSTVIEDPKLSTVREALNNLITQDFDVPPAKMTYDMVTVHDANHIKTALGLSVGYKSVNFGANFDFSRTTKKTHTIVDFTQEYYTLDLDLPKQPSDFFKPGARNFFYEGDLTPVYLSSVTMGRKLYICIDSEMTDTEVKAALNASFNAVLVSGSASTSVDFNKLNEKSTIKAYVLGGDADGAAVNIGDFTKFRELIISGAKFGKNNIGVPISYKLRNLNNNSTFKTVLYNKYTKTTYEKTIPKNYAVTFKIENVSLNAFYKHYYSSLRGEMDFIEKSDSGDEAVTPIHNIWKGSLFKVISKDFGRGLMGDKQLFQMQVYDKSKKFPPTLKAKIDMKNILEKFISDNNSQVYTQNQPLKLYLVDELNNQSDPDNYVLVSVSINTYN